jgi:predicted nucleotidyltransferase component of viral defense system
MFSPQYEAQTELLIHCIPEVTKQQCFGLKGGTAINLFLRDMPRVSVDIDLTYLPLEPRAESLQEIEQGLIRMKDDIERHVAGTHVKELRRRRRNRHTEMEI